MVQLNQEIRLPTSAELPSSDDTPVDNENQNLRYLTAEELLARYREQFGELPES